MNSGIIKVKNIFAAVFEKSILESLLQVLDKQSFSLNKNSVRFWGTEGTVKYLKQKGFRAQSVVSGFDFDGRIKTLQKEVFARILADRSKKKHLVELQNVILEGAQRPIGSKQEILSLRSRMTEERDREQNHLRGGPLRREASRMDSSKVEDFEPFDLVIVDLYKPSKKNFPESMDIGGQALIRSAIKNYKNVALAFDARSLKSLVGELVRNNRSTTMEFRKKQASGALKFIAKRCQLESMLSRSL